jgi:hypothetical protein
VAEKADFEATVRKLNNELANKNGNSFIFVCALPNPGKGGYLSRSKAVDCFISFPA